MTGAGLDAYDEARVGIGTGLLIGFAGLIAALFTWGAIAVPMWGWLVALPMDLMAMGMMVWGARRRQLTAGRSGVWTLVVGGLLVGASIPAAFLLGDALAS